MKNAFSAADIMLPCFINECEGAKKWSVVACDQFTSEPEYWESVYSTVGDSPSTVNMILPEAFLSTDNENSLERISEHMNAYEKDALKTYNDALVLVRRTLSNGSVRTGIVGKIDLEEYDYSVGSTSFVRATEGTVLERIPPRVAVRRAASLELPHVMLLIDDTAKTVIEPLFESCESFDKLYDFDLMLGGGHIEGYLLCGEAVGTVQSKLNCLFEKNGSSIHFAVGDGNHSLASAKARYEELKAQIGADRAAEHPLRYALCEVVNLHDSSLVFEPIYRLVNTDNPEKLMEALEEHGKQCQSGTQSVKCIYGDREREISLGGGTHTLTVGTLQKFLDDYIKRDKSARVDYIHGMDSIKKLSSGANAVGFVFEGMRKEELFEAVENDGALPRKTFSMGEAQDKRYYTECRKITE